MDVEDIAARKTEYQAALAAFIRERRQVLGLTQTQLATRVGWAQERISNLESGNYGLPTILALSRLATAMESSLFEMLEAAGFDQRTVSKAREEGHDRENALALLYTLQRILAIQATSLKETLDEASDMLAEVMGADKIDTLIYEPEKETLVALGTSDTPMGKHEHRIGMDLLPLANGGREAEVFQTGKPYWSGHAKDDPAMLRGMTEGLGVQSLIIVPMDVNGVRRGIVMAASARQDHFLGEDLPFLEAVARWVGMVVHRTQLAKDATAGALHTERQVTGEELTTVLAHDLGNHLTPLKGHIDLLKRKAQRGEQSDYLAGFDQALAAVSRIGKLIENVLNATRLEHGLFALSIANVDLVLLIQDIAQRYDSAKTPIHVRLPDELLAAVDASTLCQAIENLVSNAIQHSPEGVAVEIVLSEENREHRTWALIDVRDEGPGIPADIVETLFDRFAKGSASHGLGLGLFLARGIAEAHGGTLTVESKVGAGSTFRLWVPLIAGTQATSHVSAQNTI